MPEIFEFLLFLLFVIICLFLPGRFLARKTDIFTSLSVGLVTFTILAYTLSWLKLQLLIIPIYLIVDALAVRQKLWAVALPKYKDLKPLLLVLILSAVFTFPMLSRGIWGQSISFERDDLWHLALINELKANFPPNLPGFSGVPLTGYHFFYNFLAAQVSNSFYISTATLHFHFLPIFLAFMWGLGVYSLMILWTKKTVTAIIAVFMTMFAGSFAFILPLRGHEGFSLDSAYGIQQPATSLYNPPFAVSIIFLLAALIAIYQYLNSKNIQSFSSNKNWLLVASIIAGIISMFKVYAGIVILPALALLGAHDIFKKKFFILLAGVVSVFLFAATTLVFVNSSEHLIFYPLWRPHEVLNNFPWYGYEEKMYTFRKLGVVKGILETELYGLQIFTLGNLGTRIIGITIVLLIVTKKKFRMSFFSTIVLAMTLVAYFIPLLFIHTGKVFEIIQTAWYFLFLAGIICAIGLGALFGTNKLPGFVKAILLLIFIVPTLVSTFWSYREFSEKSKTAKNLNTPYYQTMAKLSELGNYKNAVLEIPPESVRPEDTGWWYANMSNPSIVAFGNKASYLSNQFINFDDANVDSRIGNTALVVKVANSQIVEPEEKEEALRILANNNITYIYSPYELPKASELKLQKIYKNDSQNIYLFEN